MPRIEVHVEQRLAAHPEQRGFRCDTAEPPVDQPEPVARGDRGAVRAVPAEVARRQLHAAGQGLVELGRVEHVELRRVGALRLARPDELLQARGAVAVPEVGVGVVDAGVHDRHHHARAGQAGVLGHRQRRVQTGHRSAGAIRPGVELLRRLGTAHPRLSVQFGQTVTGTSASSTTSPTASSGADTTSPPACAHHDRAAARRRTARSA